MFGFIAKHRGDLAGGCSLRGARCLAQWVLRLAAARTECPLAS
jgi:hypothetical protein